MLTRLHEPDRKRALDYLAAEPAYNVFAIGDIENFGFDAEFQDVWADLDGPGLIRAMVLRYYGNHIVYSRSGAFDEAAVTTLLSSAAHGWMLSGKESIVARLAYAMKLPKVESQFLAELASTNCLPAKDAGEVQPVTIADFDGVLELHRYIEEFGSFGVVAEGIRHNIESGTGRTFAVREGGRIVSSASSAAENSRSAMIIGVCTAKDFRNRGLATMCMSRLCAELLAEGRVACLFYQNPAAGRIYKRLGFRDVGRWAMASPAWKAQGTS